MTQWHDDGSDLGEVHEGEWLTALPPGLGELQPTLTGTQPPISEHIAQSADRKQFYSVSWDCNRLRYHVARVTEEYARSSLEPTLRFRRVQNAMELFNPAPVEEEQLREGGRRDRPRKSTSLVETGNGDWQTRREYADETGFSLSKVDRLLRSGRLPCYQPGGKRTAVRIPRGIVPHNEHAIRCVDQPPTAPPTGPPSAPKRLSGPSPKWKTNGPQ